METAHILVVDDEEAIREVVSTTLESRGYHCTTLSNGAAQEFVRKQTPDLVLSGMIMPEMDGIQLLDWLRGYDPEIPVIMVTAIHDISTALQAIRRGAYDYILKPFEKEQLFHAVGRAWQHRQLVTENKNYQINLPQEVERKTAEPTNALDLLTQSYDDTIAALGSALDLKDMETAGHSQRVAAYTNSIAKQERVRLSERTKAGLAIARSNGRQIGRPRLKVHSSEIARLRAEGRSLRAIGRELGISEGSVRRFVAAWVRKKGLF